MTQPHEHDYPAPRLEPVPTDARGDDVVEGIGTPDAVAAASLARPQETAPGQLVRIRGVEWVRPTDLIARHAGRMAGRGIDVQAELARRARAAAAGGARRVSDRARRLPPLGAFGRSGSEQGAVRDGVGMR